MLFLELFFKYETACNTPLSFLIISGHSRKQKLSSKFALKVCRVVNNNKSLIETLDQVGTNVSQPTVKESCIKGVFMDVSVERHRCSNKKNVRPLQEVKLIDIPPFGQRSIIQWYDETKMGVLWPYRH